MRLDEELVDGPPRRRGSTEDGLALLPLRVDLHDEPLGRAGGRLAQDVDHGEHGHALDAGLVRRPGVRRMERVAPRRAHDVQLRLARLGAHRRLDDAPRALRCGEGRGASREERDVRGLRLVRGDAGSSVGECVRAVVALVRAQVENERPAVVGEVRLVYERVLERLPVDLVVVLREEERAARVAHLVDL